MQLIWPSLSRFKVLLGAVVVLFAVSAWLASRETTAEILMHPPVIAVTVRIALGPIGGWIQAITDGAVLTALWSLVPATLFSVGPFALWMARRGVCWLTVSMAVWIAAGYLYAVAMWV